ncbi:MAG: hypothetical protein FWG27_04670 [Treponema sp.]|nr:hypothetical protein [Treponema sp.]
MKYFICTLDRVSLGIPAEWTERIIPITRLQTAVYETENQETYISLSSLLKQNNTEKKHGVVLKPKGAAVKTILLAPRIDIDLEIQEENIHELPEALAGFFGFFKGAYFTGENVILILNPEKLMGKNGD